ncbi:MAG: hypothetical protein V1716_01150 [Candidatus Uhrbacteria bacterium]
MMEIQIRPQSAEEAFLYVKNCFRKRKFYQENGYSIDLPEHPAFIEVFNNSEETFEEKENELKKIFFEDVYPKLDFSEALEKCQKNLPEILERLTRLSLQFGFKLLDSYVIVLTPYGPGGSYDSRGTIVIKTNSCRSFLERIIHEAVHIGVENEVLRKNLNHLEKEKLVESICQSN